MDKEKMTQENSIPGDDGLALQRFKDRLQKRANHIRFDSQKHHIRCPDQINCIVAVIHARKFTGQDFQLIDVRIKHRQLILLEKSGFNHAVNQGAAHIPTADDT